MVMLFECFSPLIKSFSIPITYVYVFTYDHDKVLFATSNFLIHVFGDCLSTVIHYYMGFFFEKGEEKTVDLTCRPRKPKAVIFTTEFPDSLIHVHVVVVVRSLWCILFQTLY